MLDLDDEDDELEEDESEDSEGRLDFGSITSTVNDKISSVGTSVTSGVDVSGTYTGGNLTRTPSHANIHTACRK